MLSYDLLGIINISSPIEYLSNFFFFFAVLEFGTQGLHLEPLHQPFLMMSFFKIGSLELFAWAGIEP
jgi:hypothetical protein